MEGLKDANGSVDVSQEVALESPGPDLTREKYPVFGKGGSYLYKHKTAFAPHCRALQSSLLSLDTQRNR